MRVKKKVFSTISCSVSDCLNNAQKTHLGILCTQHLEEKLSGSGNRKCTILGCNEYAGETSNFCSIHLSKKVDDARHYGDSAALSRRR